MKCELCNGKTRILSNQKYHYIESGLDNIYLVGIDVETCESCNAVSPIIPRVKAIHEAIARAIVTQPSSMSGAEARFIRKQLGYKAKEWAAFIRVDTATLSRWENSETPIGPQSDSLMRLLYLRILEERLGRMVSGSVTDDIAAIDADHITPPNICVDVANKNLYSYS